MSAEKIVIIGAGPTGLGAAWRLHELGHDGWTLLESGREAGGLAGSTVDEKGFTWDYGGHVLFSHYPYFDALMDALLRPDEWLRHERQAWVYMRNRFIPYPLQNNLWRLPLGERIKCLVGLVGIKRSAAAKNFDEWIVSRFGAGLADVFMRPYNKKVWAYSTERLGTGWVGDRVAVPSLARALAQWRRKKDDRQWGPNAMFRFPRRGGTGAIWRTLCAKLPAARLNFGTAVESVRADRKEVALSDGRVQGYDRLITTMPLDQLIRRLSPPSPFGDVADRLVYSSTHLLGLGFEGRPPESLARKCWMYFPEKEFPFYRATVFSNYSPENVPDASRQWSLLCEMSESPEQPMDLASWPERVERALRDAGLVPKDAVRLSRWQRRLPYGYPTPFVGRDALLEPVNAWLEARNIFSRGRFGAWKYEVSNQDHSLMQGVEIVNRLLRQADEVTYREPESVNEKKPNATLEAHRA